MKNLFLLFILFITAIVMNAQETVGSFYCNYFGKEYSMLASLKNNKLESVYIGVEAKSADMAFICVDAKNIQDFKMALDSIKIKYKEWCKVAKENNINNLNKEFGIKFPRVTVSWNYGSGWKFDFYVNLNMKFLILDDGRMIAVSVEDVVSSSNQYIDETVYFAFGSVEDFDNLISALNVEEIFKKLKSKEESENLFN